METIPSSGPGPGRFLLELTTIWSGFDFGDAVGVAYILACAFLSLPVFATYFALRVKNLIAGGGADLDCSVGSLLACAGCRATIPDLDGISAGFIFAIFFIYSAFALLAFSLLRHSLSRRIYSF